MATKPKPNKRTSQAVASKAGRYFDMTDRQLWDQAHLWVRLDGSIHPPAAHYRFEPANFLYIPAEKVRELIALWKEHNRAKRVAARNVSQDPRFVGFEDGLITMANDCATDLEALIDEVKP